MIGVVKMSIIRGGCNAEGLYIVHSIVGHMSAIVSETWKRLGHSCGYSLNFPYTSLLKASHEMFNNLETSYADEHLTVDAKDNLVFIMTPQNRNWIEIYPDTWELVCRRVIEEARLERIK